MLSSLFVSEISRCNFTIFLNHLVVKVPCECYDKEKGCENMKKNMQIIKYLLSVAAILYLFGVFFLPAMKPLSHSWVAWVVFGIYCLNLIFLWAIGGKKTEYHDDKEEATKEAQISQELLKDRNKWVV